MRTFGMVLLVALTACAKKAETGASQLPPTQVAEKMAPDPSDVGLILQEIDLDRDNNPEIFNYLKEREGAPRLLVRKEMDLNRDGRVDVRSFFDDSGRLVREEMDSDYDKAFDHTDIYQDGVRVMSEYDTDADGAANVHKYYVRNEQGVPVLDRKERDEDGDGKIDVWERFDATGQVVRTARDTDGDGKMDERDD
jgi:hypothetical protein